MLCMGLALVTIWNSLRDLADGLALMACTSSGSSKAST